MIEPRCFSCETSREELMTDVAFYSMSCGTEPPDDPFCCEVILPARFVIVQAQPSTYQILDTLRDMFLSVTPDGRLTWTRFAFASCFPTFRHAEIALSAVTA